MDCKDCRKCAWAIWYYGEVVECCNSDDCPSEEDFEFYADSAEDFKALCSLFGQLVYEKKN